MLSTEGLFAGYVLPIMRWMYLTGQTIPGSLKAFKQLITGTHPPATVILLRIPYLQQPMHQVPTLLVKKNSGHW